MTTEQGTVAIDKQDEREALTKIYKIIERLGEDSCVGTAFKGFFEIAENNIVYDTAYSANYYIDKCNNADDRECELKNEYERKLEEKARELESMTEKLRNVYEVANERQQQINDLLEKLDDMAKLSAQNYTAGVETEQKLAKAQDEIVKLKAQLYDLLMTEKETNA